MAKKKREIAPGDHGMGGVEVGSKEPGMDSLARMDVSAETSERDLSEGQRRRSGQAAEESE